MSFVFFVFLVFLVFLVAFLALLFFVLSLLLELLLLLLLELSRELLPELTAVVRPLDAAFGTPDVAAASVKPDPELGSPTVAGSFLFLPRAASMFWRSVPLHPCFCAVNNGKR